MANAEFSLPNLRAVMMANPSITAEELAQNFGVSVDTINNALSLDTSSWDQSVLDYYNQLENYRKQMEDQGFFLLDPRQAGGYFDPKGYFVNTSFIPEAGVSIPSMYGPANQDYYRSMMGQYTDPSQFYQTVMMYKNPTEKGQSEYFGSVVADPNKQYRLVDTNTDQVIYSGTGLEALKEINKLVPSLSTKPSETWSLDVSEGGDKWTPSGVQKVNSGTPWFIQAFPYVLGALATAGALGAFGAAPGAATGTTAAGSTAAGATGATTGALSTTAASLLPAAGEIVVTGALPTATSLGGTLASLGATGGALGSSLGSTAGSQGVTQPSALQQQFDATFGTQCGGGGLASVNPITGELTVTGSVPGIGVGNLAAYTAPAAASLTGVSGAQRLAELQNAAQPPETVGASDIVVSAGGQPPIDVSGILASTAPITTQVAKEIAKQTAAQQAGKGPLTVNNALKAASLVGGLLGAGVGGGGAASGASRPLGSIFSAQLPTTSKIATARQPFAVMPDMTRYGRGTPSLAAQVPQYGGVMPPGFNPETMEWLGPQMEETENMAWGGYAEGGVDGPGDGRSDSIPAQLSDGEYVIDAETVALLGNGSNKAGAKKLDQFRVNIRKSKGKHLAKGKFSVNAKKPESYLGAK